MMFLLLVGEEVVVRQIEEVVAQILHVAGSQTAIKNDLVCGSGVLLQNSLVMVCLARIPACNVTLPSEIQAKSIAACILD